jgi:hypothetical protein
MLLFLILLALLLLVISGYFLTSKNIHIWFLSYIRQQNQGKIRHHVDEPVHIVFACVDHFEPAWNGASYEDEVRRVDTWLHDYPKMANKHYDWLGKHPQHTFFYPIEEYKKEHLDKLAQLVRNGYGEVEIHLHHENDTALGLRDKIESFKSTLRCHGLLNLNRDGEVTYGFIHGDWALDNSGKNGKSCGVNNELQVLGQTGCYADFTLPSAPSETQTKKINSIYYATGDLLRPKSHDTGIDVEVGKESAGDLMIIQGPLTLNWRNRKYGIFPRIENGEITVENPPTEQRIDLWIQQHIHVKGAPNWVFVKVHTHGCQEKHKEILLGKYADAMYYYLESKYNDIINYRLHYATARGMYNIIKSLESGKKFQQ